jgi:hypothetical protein
VNDFAGSLIVWLRPQLAPDAQIAGKVLSPMPAQFVRVARIGGPYQPPMIDTPTVMVEAWAGTEAAAHALIQKVRRLTWSLRGGMLNGMAVYRMEEFAGPAWLPDPDHEGRPRFTFTLSVAHREEMTA